MANKSYMAENRELAYRIWRECGQNVELTLRKLKAHPDGFPLTKPTLYEWIETYGWKDRAARAEAEERKATDAVISADGRAVACLEKVRTRYEKYFESLGECQVDNQASFAYAGVISKITEINMKSAAFKAACFLDFMKDLIDWMGRNDPDGVRVIEKNFDDFVTWAREKYGN